ncbi:MAG: orotate phosphoribosyltransferase, partial [Gemmatimonadota bacterium]|nr:orotate phosphoribosyltransferase [Gemmatimonadota bacterium]
MTSGIEDLRSLLKERSLRLGDFTLASGRKSTYYVDARPTTMSAKGIEVIGRLGIDAVIEAGWEADCVGGLTLGADPVAYAIAVASLQTDMVLDGFTVRKQAKGYGEKRRVEGGFAPGHRVVVVEDVITTGGSALDAAKAIEDE